LPPPLPPSYAHDHTTTIPRVIFGHLPDLEQNNHHQIIIIFKICYHTWLCNQWHNHCFQMQKSALCLSC